MTHYPFPDNRGTKIAFAAFFMAMLFLARDSMFTTAVIGFEKAQFLMLGVICLLGAAFLIVNRRNLLKILKDRRMIVAGIAAAVLLLPMLVKRDWQLMYFSVLLCLLTAVLLSYCLTVREAAKYYVAILSLLGAYSVLAAYILRIGVDKGAYAVPVFQNSMGFEFHNFFLSIVPDTYVKNRNFGIFREPGVYQFFLITALYLNNYEVEWKKPWQLWLVNGILAATMASTFAILCRLLPAWAAFPCIALWPGGIDDKRGTVPVLFVRRVFAAFRSQPEPPAALLCKDGKAKSVHPWLFQSP